MIAILKRRELRYLRNIQKGEAGVFIYSLRNISVHGYFKVVSRISENINTYTHTDYKGKSKHFINSTHALH